MAGYSSPDFASEADLIHAEDSLRLHQQNAQVNDNDSGYCEDCGEKIPESRLRAVPNACYCFKCQSKFESKGPIKMICRNVYVP